MLFIQRHYFLWDKNRWAKIANTNVTLTLFVGHCGLDGVPVLIQLLYRGTHSVQWYCLCKVENVLFSFCVCDCCFIHPVSACRGRTCSGMAQYSSIILLNNHVVFQEAPDSRMFGLDLSMRNRVRDFDSGMWFLSFVAAMAMTLPVAFLTPELAFGKRSLNVLNRNVFKHISLNNDNIFE